MDTYWEVVIGVVNNNTMGVTESINNLTGLQKVHNQLA